MTMQESAVDLDVITAMLKELQEAERVKFYYMLIGARAIEGFKPTSNIDCPTAS